MSSRRIGVFGGTFNPMHNAVLEVARAALARPLHFEKIIFVPNGTPPHKKEGVLDKELRYELAKAGTADEPRFEVSRLEIDRPGVTWSIDTVRELRKQYCPCVKLYFIVGEDNVRSFAGYDRRAEFFSYCGLAVAPRKYQNQSDLEQWRKLLPGAEILLIDCSPSGLSATEIRDLIKAGKPYCQHVPKAICEIIEARGLYRDGENDPGKAA